MEKDLDNLVSRVKSQILQERSHKKGKFRYSDKLRLAVLDLFPEIGSPGTCAKLLGLTPSILFRWKNEQNIPPPRRLVVAADTISVPLVEAMKLPTFDAVLANGITLRGLSLTSECLQILGSLK